MNNGKPHDVHLSQPAQAVLRALSEALSKDKRGGKGESCDFVFSTTGETSISGSSRAKARLNAAVAEARAEAAAARDGPRPARPLAAARGSQSCRHYQSLTLVPDTTARAITSSRTNRCWQSRVVPARQTTSLDVLCLMSAVSKFAIEQNIRSNGFQAACALSHNQGPKLDIRSNGLRGRLRLSPTKESA
jgi:hypothetical protein